MLEKLPGGRELLEIIRKSGTQKSQITFPMINVALQEHFLELRRNAEEQAEEKDLVVRNIVLSYPHYLLHEGSQEDEDRYLRHYKRLMSDVWGKDIQISTVKEGLALSLYLSEKFDEAPASLSQKKLQALYGKMNCGTGPMNLVIIDMGGSSLVCFKPRTDSKRVNGMAAPEKPY
jgi:hypothetical protein